MQKREYESPKIEQVPLVAKEAVLSHCKCAEPQLHGPPTGWCSHVGSCETVGS